MIVQYTAAAIVNDLASRAHAGVGVFDSRPAPTPRTMCRWAPTRRATCWRWRDDLGKVLALELYTAAQALDLRMDMINAARDLSRRADAAAFAAKVQGGPHGDATAGEIFHGEVEGLRAELAKADEFHPGQAVAAAHAAIRSEIPFLDRDRAMDGEVGRAVALVESGKLLDAIRQTV